MYDAVQAWTSATRRRRGLSHTDELTVWLDRACLRGGSEITDTVLLACLPIFLAGCKQLLVLAGPTFSSRRWCATELFAFIRSACNAPRRQAARPAERADPDSLLFLLTGANARARLGLACVCVCVFAVGGALDEIDIRLVLGTGTGVDRVEEAGAIKAALTQFDATQAQCTLTRDRHRILAVVETAYGTVELFNG